MAEDWLPKDPPPNQKSPSSGWRTFLVWFVLMLFFYAVYAMFDDGSSTEGFSGFWLVGAGLFGLFAGLLLLSWQFMITRRFNDAQAPGLEALAQQRPQQAAEIFAALAKRSRTRAQHYVVATYNHGYALLRAGNSAEAVSLLLRVDRTPKLQVGGIPRLVAIQLARGFAIGGDTAKAAAWVEAARKRPGPDDPIYSRAILVSVEALVRCREGKYDEALAIFEANWHVLERYLSLDLMAEPWLLRAYAIAMKSSVRDAAVVEPWLRALRVLPPDQSWWLTRHWPELEQFAIAHDVLRAAPPPAPVDVVADAN